jgi:hypothetical protein
MICEGTSYFLKTGICCVIWGGCLAKERVNLCSEEPHSHAPLPSIPWLTKRLKEKKKKNMQILQGAEVAVCPVLDGGYGVHFLHFTSSAQKRNNFFLSHEVVS